MSPFQLSIILCSPFLTPCSWRKKFLSHLFHSIFSCSGLGDWGLYMRRGKKFVSHFSRWIGTRGVSSGSKGDWPVKNTWFWLSWWVCTTFISKFNFSIADIYISISTGTFDIENIKYEKKLATVRFRYILWTIDPGKIVLVAIIVISGRCYFKEA